jgi:hypothetical protein
MIRALRRRHFAVWIALAVLLPLLVLAAIRARRETAPRPLPDALAPHAVPADDVAEGSR